MRRVPIERKYWKEGVLMKTDLLSLKLDVAETKGCSFDWGDGNDLQSIARHLETSGKHPVHARRLEAGHRCFCASKEGKVLAFNWVSFDCGWVNFGKEGELSFFPLPSRSVFTDDLYTYTDARRQGIGALLKAHEFASLRSMGIDTAYNYILLSNSASLGLFLKLGSVAETLLYCLCLGNYCRAFMGTGGEARRLKYWAQPLREPLKDSRSFRGNSTSE
jgi:GNAT superfamily N-acetyltransferase